MKFADSGRVERFSHDAPGFTKNMGWKFVGRVQAGVECMIHAASMDFHIRVARV